MGFGKRNRRARLGSWVKATLVTREWSRERGLIEHESTLEDLAELLDTCFDADGPVLERITLTGLDADGRELTVSFSFASSTRRT